MRGELEVDKNRSDQVPANRDENQSQSQDLDEHPDSDPEYFEVSCRLIPLGPALVMILFCLLISTFSWIIASFINQLLAGGIPAGHPGGQFDALFNHAPSSISQLDGSPFRQAKALEVAGDSGQSHGKTKRVSLSPL